MHKEPVKFLSLFSGIEAASIAWEPLGWKCVGFSEIEPFPCAVLQHYYPDIPNLGDITKITEEQIAALGHIDLVIFGSPCTDFSVAGKRAGLKDEEGNITRSGLFYTAMDIVRYARKHCGTRWAILENVPGIYSSHEGRDFSTVIGEMVGCRFDVPTNGWGNSGIALGPDGLCEWACLDARHFGVAQRRRRVFAVCDYAIFDSGNWKHRESVLLERKSMRWNPTPRREAGQEVAGTVASRFGTSRNNPEELAPIGIDEEGNATENGFGPLMHGGEGGTRQSVACYENHAQDSRVKDCGNLAPQLNAKAGTGGGNLPLVQNLKPQAMRMVAFGEYSDDDSASAMKSRDHKDATDLVLSFNPQSGGDCRGLDLKDTAQIQRHQITGVAIPINGMTLNKELKDKQTTGIGNDGDPSPALRGSGNQHAVAVDIYNTTITGDVSATLSNEGGSSTGSGPKVLAFAQNTRDEVRLQGGDGQNVGALAAEPGMKQTTYLAIEKPQPVAFHRNASCSVTEQDGATAALKSNGEHSYQFLGVPIDCREGTSPCLTAKIQGSSGWAPQNETEHLVPVAMVNMQGSKGNSVAQDDGPSFTLNAMHGHDVHAVAVRTANTNANGCGIAEEVAHTIDRAQGQAVAAPSLTSTNDPSRSPQSSEVTQQVAAVHATSMALRRLTPEECEALQGFPRGHTRIPWKGKSADDCPDSVRYKSLGNSFAVPVVAWIGRRIQRVMDGVA